MRTSRGCKVANKGEMGRVESRAQRANGAAKMQKDQGDKEGAFRGRECWKLVNGHGDRGGHYGDFVGDYENHRDQEGYGNDQGDDDHIDDRDDHSDDITEITVAITDITARSLQETITGEHGDMDYRGHRGDYGEFEGDCGRLDDKRRLQILRLGYGGHRGYGEHGNEGND